MKMGGLLLAAGTLLAPLSGAWADPQLNVDFYDFEGRAFIENNPVSSTCAADGLTFGDAYTVVYRFNTGTNVVPDAISFTSERSAYRYNATPSFSLSGNQIPVAWVGINSRANFFEGVDAVANTIISPPTITSETKTVVIVGAVTNFFGNTGCTLQFHAALERRPD